MLTINIPEIEYYDGVTEEFIITPSKTLQLEHSLVALSKWESKWMRSFLGTDDKSEEEMYSYIQCMSVNDSIDMFTIKNLSQVHIDAITNYIHSPMTATKLPKSGNKTSREIITSELVYYWMVSFNIPFECQHWHLNRLLTLINVCNIKNTTPKKESPKETLSRNAAINAARKKAMNTSG